MKRKAFLILFYSLLISLLSCHKDIGTRGTTDCDSSNTNFNQLYNNLISVSNFENSVTMDLETHSYSFEVTTAKTICKIGYQSLPNFNTTPYLIEIFDSTSNALVYSGSHTFSSNATSYISITPIHIIVGHFYTINRIQKNWSGNIGNTIGRLVKNPNGNIVFPVVFGDLKIIGSTFYGTGGPKDNWAIPYIDIVFE